MKKSLLQWDRRVSSCDSFSSLIDYIIASCCSVNGHIEACLSSLGLAIELELHQYSLNHIEHSLCPQQLQDWFFLSSSVSFLQFLKSSKGSNTPCCLKKAVHITHKACLKHMASAKWKICVGWRPDYRSNSFAKTVFFHFCQDNCLFFFLLNVGPLLDDLKFSSLRIACI